jgi:hypothetical protein
MPRTINFMAAKIIWALAREYETLWHIFQDGIAKDSSADRLTAEVDAGKNRWRDVSDPSDGNLS